MTYAILFFGAFMLFLIFMFNNLVAKKNKTKEAYSSIDVMLKKRVNLIPRLISSVKGYMSHEKETLTEITRLREKMIHENPEVNDRFHLESQLGMMLGKLQVGFEAYPDLRASENFLQLQASLNEIEEQISAARRAYNAAIVDFNNALEMFPSNIMAKAMGYQQQAMFVIDKIEKMPPEVKF